MKEDERQSLMARDHKYVQCACGHLMGVANWPEDVWPDLFWCLDLATDESSNHQDANTTDFLAWTSFSVPWWLSLCLRIAGLWIICKKFNILKIEVQEIKGRVYCVFHNVRLVSFNYTPIAGKEEGSRSNSDDDLAKSKAKNKKKDGEDDGDSKDGKEKDSEKEEGKKDNEDEEDAEEDDDEDGEKERLFCSDQTLKRHRLLSLLSHTATIL